MSAYSAGVLITALTNTACILAKFSAANTISIADVLDIRGAVPAFGCLSLFVAAAAMIPTWRLAIGRRAEPRLLGGFYVSAAGGAANLLLGCAASSLLPKPSFIEDQTFVEGLLVAATRQGGCLILSGVLGGMTCWLFANLRQMRQT